MDLHDTNQQTCSFQWVLVAKFLFQIGELLFCMQLPSGPIHVMLDIPGVSGKILIFGVQVE